MLPVLYSFRRCPYAIRARMALQYSGTAVELREVILREMPASLLEASPKSTVPVLILPDGNIIDESWDIVLWAINKHDPDYWLGKDKKHLPAAIELITTNDYSFKPNLDRYKYADRHPEHSAEYYRAEGEKFLQALEQRLSDSTYLLGENITVADIGVFPFIRQFCFVDKDWFDQAPYPCLKTWLESLLKAGMFTSVMSKYPAWSPGDEPVLFS